MTLYDAEGGVFAEKDFRLQDTGSGKTLVNKHTLDVTEPELWDADHPNLYTAVISLYNRKDGIHYESVSQNIGFRKLTFTSTQVSDTKEYKHTTEQYETVRLNGKRLLLKGVNRHDSDPETGKYVSREVYEADVKMMKQNNINALRTSHYANDDYLYYLCDRYGLYLLCEYDHAMGNAVGNLKEYWDIFRSSDNMLGGFIWDWVDQSRKIPLPEGGWDYYGTDYAHASGLNRLEGYYLGYGGDWGDKINDANFCHNGLVSADRDPQPELKEVKYQYQDFLFSIDGEALQGKQLTIKNESISKNLSEYNLIWELQEDNRVIDSGRLEEKLPAGEQKELVIPYELPAKQKEGAEYFLNLSVQTKEDGLIMEKGTEIAYGQFRIAAQAPAVRREISAEGVSVEKKKGDYLVTGQDFRFEVDRRTGYMKNYIYQDHLILKQGPAPNIDRALLDNDTYLTYHDALDHISLKGEPKASRDRDGRYVITVSQKMKTEGEEVNISAVYTVDGSGAVAVAWNYDFSAIEYPEFAKIGAVLTLPDGSEEVCWYGNGDGESYSDRSTYTRVGEYTNTVSAMYYPFARPQDCGNLTGVKWISVSNEDTGYGVLITGEQDVNASALHFTAKMLQEAEHIFDLQPAQETYLTVDALVSGTGNASCGYQTLEDYVVDKRKCNYEFTIIPVNQLTDKMETAKRYKSEEE